LGPQSRPLLKITMSKSGALFVDGTNSSFADLDARLARLAERGGEVWYYREDGQEDPPPIALDVMSLVLSHRVPVSMSSRSEN